VGLYRRKTRKAAPPGSSRRSHGPNRYAGAGLMTRDGTTETLALIGFDLSRDGATVLRASAPCRGRAICSTVSATQWSLRPTWASPPKERPRRRRDRHPRGLRRIGTELTPPATTLIASRLPGKRTRAFARTLTVTRVGAHPAPGKVTSLGSRSTPFLRPPLMAAATTSARNLDSSRCRGFGRSGSIKAARRGAGTGRASSERR